MSGVPPRRYPGRASWRASSAAATAAQRATMVAFGRRPRKPVSDQTPPALAWGACARGGEDGVVLEGREHLGEEAVGLGAEVEPPGAAPPRGLDLERAR